MQNWTAACKGSGLLQIASVQCRCGPFEPALRALQDDRMKQLVNGMVTATLPLSEGVNAVERASTKGALKVQLLC